MRRLPINTLSYFVISYMILAFGWWSFHLWKQNIRLFEREKQVAELIYTNVPLESTPLYQSAMRNLKSGQRMVIGEGLFFTACLIFGIWVIRRSASREVSLTRQRRNFLLSITHELKSPIASLRLVLETLNKRKLTPEQSSHLLQNGLKDADRLQALVESLLLAARLEDNWRPLPEPLAIEPLVNEIAESLRIRFPDAEIRLKLAPGLPPVNADKMGLTAVVQNLLENALKYSPEGSAVEVAVAQKAGKFVLMVSDQGQGIPDEEKKAVFEKFYRMGNEDTRSSTGTGLGLYIVNQVTKAHGGTISVSDNTPRGTIFTVEI